MPRQWNSEQVMGTLRSFQPACVLSAAVDLDVFVALADGPATAATLARRLQCDPRGLTILLDALAALELLTKRGRRYRVPPAVAAVLAHDGQGSQRQMALHLGNCLRRWVQLARIVKTGRPGQRTPSLRGEKADQASFIGAMDNISAPMALNLVQAIGLPPFQHALDVGGASGTWTIALLRAVPGARATLFDLPAVIPMARRRLRAAGVLDRVTLTPGDFYRDPLPRGADFAWVSAIVHQNSRRQNRELLRKVRAALTPGGRIAIRDIVMDESRTQPAGGALFAVNMLAATPAGGTFTFRELRDDLKAAGFRRVTLARRGQWMDSVVLAQRG